MQGLVIVRVRVGSALQKGQKAATEGGGQQGGGAAQAPTEVLDASCLGAGAEGGVADGVDGALRTEAWQLVHSSDIRGCGPRPPTADQSFAEAYRRWFHLDHSDDESFRIGLTSKFGKSSQQHDLRL